MNLSFYHSAKINKEGKPENGWSYLGQLNSANMIKVKLLNGPWIMLVATGDGEYLIKEPDVKQHGE